MCDESHANGGTLSIQHSNIGFTSDPESGIIYMRGDDVVIYKITNKTNGKVYVGQTTRDLETRIAEHSRKQRTVIEKAINKYGIDNFTVEQIDDGSNVEELNQKEIEWISKLNCTIPYGYNQCNGGDNTEGFNHRESSKKKMSKAHISLNKVGERNPFFGANHTDEQREKWSKDRKADPRYQENMRKAHLASLKSIKVKVINLDTEEVFESVKEASERYNLKPTHISRVCRGKRNKTGGFRWKYYDEYMKIPCQDSNKE